MTLEIPGERNEVLARGMGESFFCYFALDQHSEPLSLGRAVG